MNNLNVGGAEKALISLLQTINYSLYDVDLQLFQNKGVFLVQLPRQVNLLPEIETFSYYDMPGIKAVFTMLKRGKFRTLINRLAARKVFASSKNAAVKEQLLWNYISPCVPASTKTYDAALGFLEKTPAYYVVDKVNAAIKIGYIQNDYDMLGMDEAFDEPYFKKLKYIVTCAPECKVVLDRRFPDKKDKIVVIENIVSPKLINNFSLEETDENFPHTVNIVSVGRLENQKGYDLAVEALRMVKDAQQDFHWFILGEGSLQNDLQRQIKELGLQESVTFVGVKENHYPYLRQADIFMQTSRFEGKSIAIEEAKIMAKPIVVTRFSTVNDQIQDGETGIIADMNPQGIAEKLMQLIADPNLRDQLSANLKSEKLGNEEEIYKLYRLIEGQ